jgi:hypothetical protein
MNEKMSFLLHIKAVISKRISREFHDPFYGRISNMPLAFGCLTSQFILSGWRECNTIYMDVDCRGECGCCQHMMQDAFS